MNSSNIETSTDLATLISSIIGPLVITSALSAISFRRTWLGEGLTGRDHTPLRRSTSLGQALPHSSHHEEGEAQTDAAVERFQSHGDQERERRMQTSVVRYSGRGVDEARKLKRGQ